MSLSSATFFGTSTALSTNHKVQAGPTGNITGNALTFAQTPKTDGGQDITFTFTAPIYELSFIITDIDNGLTGDGEVGDAGFSDRVVILPVGGVHFNSANRINCYWSRHCRITIYEQQCAQLPYRLSGWKPQDIYGRPNFNIHDQVQ